MSERKHTSQQKLEALLTEFNIEGPALLKAKIGDWVVALEVDEKTALTNVSDTRAGSEVYAYHRDDTGELIPDKYYGFSEVQLATLVQNAERAYLEKKFTISG